MSSPDEPEVPEHEKSAMELHGKLAQHGSKIIFNQRDNFALDASKDRMSSSRGTANADRAIMEAKAMKKVGVNPIQVAKGTVSIRDNTDFSAGTKSGYAEQVSSIAKSGAQATGKGLQVGSTLTGLSNMEHSRNMRDFAQDVQSDLDTLQTIGGIAGTIAGSKYDGRKVPEAEKRQYSKVEG